MRSIHREPLVHFLAAGLCIFGLYSVLDDGGADQRNRRVVVDRDDVDRLRSTFAQQWARQPTLEELKALIDGHVREEVLYREAVAMDLDAYDAIVRRRMVQKLEFLADDIAAPTEPTEAELAEYFQEHAWRYRTEARVSFTHIFFSTDRRTNADGDARRLHAALSVTPDSSVLVPERGDPFMLPFNYRSRTRQDIEQVFGTGFAAALFRVRTMDTWEGPIRSSYGYHLVRLTGREDSTQPELSTVKHQVRQDLESERRTEAKEAFLQSLLSGYEVTIDENALAEGGSPSSAARGTP